MKEEIPKLTDIINERVAELIQVGFNAAARRRFGRGREVKAAMTIVEKKNGSYHRIPEGPLPEWTDYCKYIRGYTDQDGSKLGDQLCCDCDAAKAEEFFAGTKRAWEWYICHAGLVDIAIPIAVGGEVVAVFFGGQKRLKDNREYNDELSRRIADLASKVPGLKESKLSQLARKVATLTESDIEEFAGQLSEIVSHIGDLARRNYEARRAVAVMGRFSEEYMLRRRTLADVLAEILGEIARFLSVEEVILVRDTIQDAVVSSRPLTCALVGDPDVAEDVVANLLRKMPVSGETASFIKSDDDGGLVDYLAQSLGLSGLCAAFLKSVSFSGGRKGVFLYTNPQLAKWELANDDIMTQRQEFVHDLSERLRRQIDMYELDKEKDDLMAEVTHRLKSPMQWLMSETSTLVPRLEFLKKWRDFDPEIVASLEKIEDIIYFLDAQTRNYTIIATMEKEGVAYNMKMHPLGTLIERCVERYCHFAQERGLEIKLSIGRGCYRRSLFDWAQLEVVINNLLDNAIKYSHAKQTVNVRARFDRDSNKFLVGFSSFGVGIAPAEHTSIFDKFRRGRIMKDPRRFIPGTGIGLTVARRLARDHGGELRLIECKQGPGDPGRGHKEEGWKVVFELELPLREENERTNNE